MSIVQIDRGLGLAELDERTREWVERLEKREAKRKGITVKEARQSIANHIGVPIGTLENVRRGRLKGVREWVSTRIRAALIEQIKKEIRGLEHERKMVEASARGACPLEVAEIDASLQAIKALITPEGSPL